MTDNSAIEISTLTSTDGLTSHHAIIVLASGLSRRLGEPKQLLCKNGEPLITHMVKLALSTKPQAIIIVIPNDNSVTQTQSSITKRLQSVLKPLATQFASIHTVINPIPETGMAQSLNLAIEAIKRLVNVSIEQVLIMAVDQVLLDKAHLMALLTGSRKVVASSYVYDVYDDDVAGDNDGQRIDREKDKRQTIKPPKDIIGIPLVIDYKQLKCWQISLIGDKGLRSLIRELPSHDIFTVKNNQLSYDIDTPKQLIYAKQQGWLDK